MAGPNGTTIETILTNCDLIAKWERVVVYAKQRSDILKMRLFEYDPAYDMPFPQITFSNDNDMLIAVPAISSVIFKENFGMDIVSYRIGKTYYPDPAFDSFASWLALAQEADKPLSPQRRHS